MSKLTTFLAAAFVIGTATMFATAAPKTPTGTITVREGSDLTYGGIIQFDYTIQANNWRVKSWIEIHCAQNGTSTFDYINYYETYDWPYAVSPGSGDASLPSQCVAQLRGSYKSGSQFIEGAVLGSTFFEVDP